MVGRAAHRNVDALDAELLAERGLVEPDARAISSDRAAVLARELQRDRQTPPLSRPGATCSRLSQIQTSSRGRCLAPILQVP